MKVLLEEIYFYAYKHVKTVVLHIVCGIVLTLLDSVLEEGNNHNCNIFKPIRRLQVNLNQSNYYFDIIFD